MSTTSSDEPEKEKTFAEKNFPNPSDMLELMVSMQRLGSQMMWTMSDAMADMMARPLRRDSDKDKDKEAPINRCVTELRDAVDSATEVLQQGGRPR